MDFKEALAEKFRAAFTRKEPEIRDYYDIWYSVKNDLININDRDLIEIVKRKIEIIDHGAFIRDLSNIKSELQLQIEADFRPVLRLKDFNKFNFNEAFSLVTQVYEKIYKVS